MTDNTTIEAMKRIELYILGKLNQNEIDDLWIEFLKAPELYELFEIELLLRSYGRNAKKCN